MAKLIEVDLSDVDPEDSKAGSFEPPKPGIYSAKVKEINDGFSKNDDGSEDPNRRRLEVIFEVTGPTNKGAPLWWYIPFGQTSKWKMDQFLQAVGVVNERKRKVKFDPAKITGTPVKIRVREGTNREGNYRAEVGSVMPSDDGGASTAPSDDELLDDDDTLADDTADDTGDGRREELEAMKVSELKPIAKDLGLTLSDFRNKDSLIDGILDAEADGPADDDDEELLEDDEELIDDEELAEEGYSRDDLTGMDVAELKEAAKAVGFTIAKGMKKSDVIDGILEAQGGDDFLSDDDEVPF